MPARDDTRADHALPLNDLKWSPAYAAATNSRREMAGMTKFANSMQLYAEAWAAVAELIDLQLGPLGLATMDALAPTNGQTILDVGCGAARHWCSLQTGWGLTAKSSALI